MYKKNNQRSKGRGRHVLCYTMIRDKSTDENGMVNMGNMWWAFSMKRGKLRRKRLLQIMQENGRR
jgi:hypothetical protein